MPPQRTGPKSSIIFTDLDKVDFVLGNIRNHFDGTGGPNKVTIALVVHGPALKAFRSTDAAGDVSKRDRRTVEIGSADACLPQYHEGPESNAQRFAAGLRRCRQRRRGAYR